MPPFTRRAENSLAGVGGFVVELSEERTREESPLTITKGRELNLRTAMAAAIRESGHSHREGGEMGRYNVG